MKADAKQMDTWTNRFWGAVFGVALAAIGGQFWPGYMLDSSVATEVRQASEQNNNNAASLVCQEIFANAPDATAKFVALRALSSYQVSQDAGVNAAVEQAMKRFAAAKILPEPSSYRVKNDCGEQLYKTPARAAELKK